MAILIVAARLHQSSKHLAKAVFACLSAFEDADIALCEDDVSGAAEVGLATLRLHEGDADLVRSAFCALKSLAPE